MSPSARDVVSTTHGMSLRSGEALISRSTSRPSIRGSRRSSRIRWGRSGEAGSRGGVGRVPVVEGRGGGLAVFEVDELEVGVTLVEAAPDELGVVEVVLDQKDPERGALAAFAFCHA